MSHLASLISAGGRAFAERERMKLEKVPHAAKKQDLCGVRGWVSTGRPINVAACRRQRSERNKHALKMHRGDSTKRSNLVRWLLAERRRGLLPIGSLFFRPPLRGGKEKERALAYGEHSGSGKAGLWPALPDHMPTIQKV